jgi:hypothetical protein
MSRQKIKAYTPGDTAHQLFIVNIVRLSVRKGRSTDRSKDVVSQRTLRTLEVNKINDLKLIIISILGKFDMIK